MQDSMLSRYENSPVQLNLSAMQTMIESQWGNKTQNKTKQNFQRWCES